MTDGSQQPLSRMDVRATEYTVGPEGPDAMPGKLPPFSAYTYAVELSVDEALIAGAPRVEFSKPIALFVENFIGAPVGTTVPFGSYDRTRGVWLPEPNGRVIEVIGSNGGVAILDVSGAGVAATSLELVELGITEGELQKIALLYGPGQELWRTTMDHFTPCDPNWALEVPEGAMPIAQPLDQEDPERDCDQQAAGSIIGCYRQSLGENVSVAGTPFRLHYESSKVNGVTDQSRPAFTIQTNYGRPAVVPSFQTLTIDIGGRQFSELLDGPPTYDFHFDGLDVAGRRMQGTQKARVELCNVYYIAKYPVVTETNEAWDRRTLPPPGVFGKPQIAIWSGCGTWDELVHLGQPTALGNWDLDVHHTWDPVQKVVFKGDGGRQDSVGSAGPRGSVHQIVGQITECDYSCDPVTRGCGFNTFDCGHSYRSVPNGGASLFMEGAIDFDVHPDGSIYVLQTVGSYINTSGSPVVSVVDSEDRARRVIGLSEQCALNSETSCNGTLPATNLELGQSTDMAIGPDGMIYIASYYSDTDCHGMQIRRFSRDSQVIEHVAGADTCDPASDADGLQASNARIRDLRGMAFGPEGSLYYGEGHRIRRITLSGKVFTAVGNHVFNSNAQPHKTMFDALGTPDINVRYSAGTDLADIRDLAVTPLGEIYFSASSGVLVASVDGRLRLVAGGSATREIPDDPTDPIGAKISFQTILVGRDLAVYVYGRKPLVDSWPVSYDDAIYKIQDGRMIAIAESKKSSGGGITVVANVGRRPQGLVFHPNGQLLVLNDRSVSALEPKETIGKVKTVAAANGSELWVFDERGRHLRTLDSRTQRVIYRFEYGTDDRLRSITDAVGNETVIERDGNGYATAVVPPFAEPTMLVSGEDGLEEIRSPDGASHVFTYASGGPSLLATMTDPAGETFEFEFDGAGRLTRDEDPAGGVQTLERVELENGYEVVHRKSVTTNPTIYRATTDETGASFRHRTIQPDGTSRESVQRADGITVHRQPDGTVIEVTTIPDARHGAMTPVPHLVRTRLPSGLTRTTRETRSYSKDVFGNLHTVEVRRAMGSDPSMVMAHDVKAGIQTIVSPEGRQQTRYLDLHSRPIRIEVAGLTPIEMRYDPNGRVEWVSAGTGNARRTTTFAYGLEDGYLATIDGPLDQDTRTLVPDEHGRTERVVAPDATETRMAFDGRGMLKSLMPPGRGDHRFSFTPVGLTESYVPPSAAGGGTGVPTVYEYDLERRLKELRRADGTLIRIVRDVDTGRTTSVEGGTWQPADPTEPHVTWSHALEYQPVTGLLTKVTRTDTLGARELAFSYDGAVLNRESWNGGATGVSGTVGRTYDDHFRVNKLDVNGVGVVEYDYDRDGLLTFAGPLEIRRNASNGLLEGTALGVVTTQETVSVFGEPQSSTVTIAGALQYENTFTRDKAGRIVSRLERERDSEGALSVVTHGYGYDAVGRLKEVFTDGAMTRSYDYDANGNRTLASSALGVTVGRYDEQDRLIRYCPENPAGQASPIAGLPCIEYMYRESGALQSKRDLLQDGAVTRYRYDQLGALRSVDLPDGGHIEYEIDAAGRRIGKRVNGAKVWGLLYQSRLVPIAQLDQNNQVVSVFVYGTRPNVPDYMIRGGRAYRFAVDHVGSVRKVVDVA
jgi:YD repeat-containing protein